MEQEAKRQREIDREMKTRTQVVHINGDGGVDDGCCLLVLITLPLVTFNFLFLLIQGHFCDFCFHFSTSTNTIPLSPFLIIRLFLAYSTCFSDSIKQYIYIQYMHCNTCAMFGTWNKWSHVWIPHICVLHNLFYLLSLSIFVLVNTTISIPYFHFSSLFLPN